MDESFENFAVDTTAAQKAILNTDFLDGHGYNEDDFGKVVSVLGKLAEAYGKYLVEKTPRVLGDLELVASGDLAQSAKFDVEIQGQKILRLNFHMAEHWENMHYGEKRSKAGGAKPPPIEAIRQWITYKGIQVREDSAQDLKSVLDAKNLLAYKIQMKIWGRDHSAKRFGKEGSKFVDHIITEESIQELLHSFADVGGVVVAYGVLSKFDGSFKHSK